MRRSVVALLGIVGMTAVLAAGCGRENVVSGGLSGAEGAVAAARRAWTVCCRACVR